MDEPFKDSEILIATRDAVLPSDTGTGALYVIVPEELDVTFDKKGFNHGILYRPGCNAWMVPLYPEVETELNRRGVVVTPEMFKDDAFRPQRFKHKVGSEEQHTIKPIP